VVLATSSPTPLGVDAADIIALLAIVVSIGVMLLSAIGVLVLRTLNRMDERIGEVKDEATTAVKDLRRDLSGDLNTIWGAVRSPAVGLRDGPPMQTKNGGD
jgi:hypothetical protein